MIRILLAFTVGCGPRTPSDTSAAGDDLPKLGVTPIADVVAAMTRDEKVRLLSGNGNLWEGIPDGLRAPPPSVSRDVPGAAGTTYAIPRLGIPSIVLGDGPAGVRIDPVREDVPDRTFHATQFPIASQLASTFDPVLVEEVGKAMGEEARALGIDILLAPALNLHRNPLGGRNFEYFSEDPWLSGTMAAAVVRGVQAAGVGATVKHFVANNHEWERMWIDVQVAGRPLHELYLRGFELAIATSDPWAVMTSYNRVNGHATSAHPELLHQTLLDDWGYDGLVVTDWFAGPGVAADQVRWGNHLLMPGTRFGHDQIVSALADGSLDELAVDRNVTRILETIVRTPSFRDGVATRPFDAEAHVAVARRAARDGVVLLKNERGLPLSPGASVALFGNAAYRTVPGGTGSGDVNSAYVVPVREGLEAQGFAVDTALATGHVDHLAREDGAQPPTEPASPFFSEPRLPEWDVPASELARVTRDVDVGIFVLGRRSGEFVDRELEGDFLLGDAEGALLRRVAKAFSAVRKPFVVVLNVGGPIEMLSWRDDADAIVLAWQPGQEAGHAIADVLSGRVNPSGRLPTTFPARWEDVPSSATFRGELLRDVEGPERLAEVHYAEELRVGYRHFASGGPPPAYPFGFGLSYTTFRYDGLTLAQADGVVSVDATLSNIGAVAGREVVQVYVSAPAPANGFRPRLELVAFEKTAPIRPGGTAAVSFRITPSQLAYFDEDTSRWVLAGGEYAFHVTASSGKPRLVRSITLEGRDDVPSLVDAGR